VNVELTAREGITPRCAICHDDALEGPLLCPACHTIVHAECRVGLPCPTLGCPHGPRQQHRLVVIRASLSEVAWDAAGRAARALTPPTELVVAFLVTAAMLGSLVALSRL
jgi:hypothetical protein